MPSFKGRTVASRMSDNTTGHEITHFRRRLGGLADLYMRKRLTRDSHPGLKAIRDDGEATSDMLLVPASGGTTSDLSPVQQQNQKVANDQLESDDEDDALYAAPLFTYILVAGSKLILHTGKSCI